MKKLFVFFVLLSNVYLLHSQQYFIEDVITGLTRPVAFSFLPNGNIILTQQHGRVRIFTQANQEISTFWDFTDSCFSVQELGTIGIALDPNYNTNNRIYIYYVHKKPPIFNGQDYYHRVIVFTNNNNQGVSLGKIFEYAQVEGQGQVHAAGNMYFGRDNKLYFSFGDLVGNAQNLSNPRGKILRINTDGTSPTDNPYYDDGNPLTGNDDRIWALGLRNTFDFCFSPVNDSLYAGDNSNGPDEINFIRKGKNYGFPICTGICGNPLYKDPILELPNGSVPTGNLVYNGSQFPSLYNKFLFAKSNASRIFICTLGNPPLYDTIISSSEWVNYGTYVGPTALRQGTDGYIYNCLLGPGKIVRIRPDPTSINILNQPINFSLSQNYPNPFNPVTTIKYSILKSSHVQLKIYDPLGVEVATLVKETKQSGDYSVSWNAFNQPSGVYFYTLQAGDVKIDKKMVLVK